jgi:peptide-methionine (S)-S-oxide reductase
MDKKTETATFGTGCFWCTEALFKRLEGVKSVLPGYAGGNVKNPTYEQVCEGDTGHAEVVQIKFDPKQTSYGELLDFFWKSHDPTSLNQQGPDAGAQYRSVIFYHNPEQKKIAEKSKADAAKKFPKPIVTEIKPIKNFSKAEAYHLDYFDKNSNVPYCRFVIRPKLEKLGLV